MDPDPSSFNLDPDPSCFNMDPDPSYFNLDPDPSSFNLGLGTYCTLPSKILYNPNTLLWHTSTYFANSLTQDGLTNISAFFSSLLELHTAWSGVLRPLDRSHTHNQVMQPPEMTTLQGLGHKISHHILGGAPFDLNREEVVA